MPGDKLLDQWWYQVDNSPCRPVKKNFMTQSLMSFLYSLYTSSKHLKIFSWFKYFSPTDIYGPAPKKWTVEKLPSCNYILKIITMVMPMEIKTLRLYVLYDFAKHNFFVNRRVKRVSTLYESDFLCRESLTFCNKTEFYYNQKNVLVQIIWLVSEYSSNKLKTCLKH